MKSLLILFILPALLLGQNTDTISFTLTPQNNVSIPAIFNGKDTTNLMFHTAVSGISLTEEGVKKLSADNFNQSAEVQSWGGNASARYSENNSVKIGNTTRDSLGITEGKHSGQGTDGKFGPDFFGEKIIEINFDNNELMLHNELPDLDEGYSKLKIEFTHDIPFIPLNVKIEEEYTTHPFMLHSGYSGTLLFDDEFVGENKMNEKLETISESELKDSYGNVLKTKKVILPELDINGNIFSDIPVGIFDGEVSMQKMSVMGGDLIKRFNWFLDISGGMVYLKPNSIFEEDFK